MVDLTSRGVILTLVDHFSDYQENRLLAPVRELSVKLMLFHPEIVPMKEIASVVFRSKKLYWMYKYNFLLILKTLLIEGRRMLEDQKEKAKENTILLNLAQQIEDLSSSHVLDNVCK